MPCCLRQVPRSYSDQAHQRGQHMFGLLLRGFATVLLQCACRRYFPCESEYQNVTAQNFGQDTSDSWSQRTYLLPSMRCSALRRRTANPALRFSCWRPGSTSGIVTSWPPGWRIRSFWRGLRLALSALCWRAQTSSGAR